MDGYAYVDIARDGQSNMAIDRQLLETAERRQCAIVRLYRWLEPTLSLGHFQASVERGIHPPSAGLPVVLRASGGGAIVHDHEWTYAIALPVGRNAVGAATHLYDLIHDALVTGLRECGWDARKWTDQCATDQDVGEPGLATAASGALRREAVEAGCGQVDSPRSASRQAAPFLCFQRRSCGDIVCDGAKVVGSAQRRLGGSVLQHGSVLCATSSFAPELRGLAEVSRANARSVDASGASAERQFSKKSELESENFGYNVLSWVVAPLLNSLGVCCTRTDGPPDFISSRGT